MNKKNKFIPFVAALAVILSFFAPAMTTGVSAHGGGSEKVTFCHVPEGNPENAQTITTSINAAINGGHFELDGDGNMVGLHGGDYLGECTLPAPDPGPQPDDIVEYGAWQGGSATCEDTSVQQYRTVSTTTHVLSEDGASWVRSAPVETTEYQTDTMSFADFQTNCAPLPMIDWVSEGDVGHDCDAGVYVYTQQKWQRMPYAVNFGDGHYGWEYGDWAAKGEFREDRTQPMSAEDIDIFCLKEAIPTAPFIVTANECGEPGSVSTPDIDGLQYSVSAPDGDGNVTVTVVALQGFFIPEGYQVSWPLNIYEGMTECPSEPSDNWNVASITLVCEDGGEVISGVITITDPDEVLEGRELIVDILNNGESIQNQSIPVKNGQAEYGYRFDDTSGWEPGEVQARVGRTGITTTPRHSDVVAFPCDQGEEPEFPICVRIDGEVVGMYPYEARDRGYLIDGTEGEPVLVNGAWWCAGGEPGDGEEPPVHPWLPSVPALTCEGVGFTIDNADAIEAEEQVRVTVYDSEYEVVSTIFVPLKVGQGVYEHLFDEALGDGTFTAGIAFGPDFAISAGSSEPVTCEAEDPGNGGTDPDPGDGDTDPDPGNGGTDPDPGDGDTDPDPGNGGTDSGEGTDDDSAPAVPAVTETPETDPVNGMPNTGDGSSLVGEASIVPVLASFAAVVVTGCWWWRLNFGGSKA